MKLSKIVLYILIVISVVVMGLFYFGGGVEETLSNAPDAEAFYIPNYTSLALNWSSILLIVAVVVAILLGVWGFVQAPKQSMKSLLGVVLLAGVLFVAYLFSDTTPITLSDGKVFSDTFRLQLSDVCIISSGILLVLTIISIVASWLMRLTK